MLAFAMSALSACRRRLGGSLEAAVVAHLLNRGPCESSANQNRCVFFPFSPANHYAPKGRQNFDKIRANIRQQLSSWKRNRYSLSVTSGLDGLDELAVSSSWSFQHESLEVINVEKVGKLVSSKLCQWVQSTFFWHYPLKVSTLLFLLFLFDSLHRRFIMTNIKYMTKIYQWMPLNKRCKKYA